MTLVHQLMPYMKLGSLLLLGGVILTGTLISLAELLPGWRARLSVGICALVIIAVLARLRPG